MSKRALCLVAEGVEELELVAPVDVLRRSGVEVVLASINRSRDLRGRNGIMLQTDEDLNSVVSDGFDLLLIPGGPAVAALRADGRAARLAREFADRGCLVAAICAGPLVLKDAGLLEGRRFTAHGSVEPELPDALTGERVVQDGPIVTSRGAGTALEFGLALVDRLCGPEEKDRVAQAIMA